MTSTLRSVVAATLLVLAVAGCTAKPGSTKANPAADRSANPVAPSQAPRGSQRPAPVEKNPPGDIPDNIAYVSYHNATGRYSFVHPEGWASVENGASVTFTDKLNGVSVSIATASAPPTVVGANSTDVAQLRATQAAFELRRVTAARLPAGPGVLIVFRRNSAPDPVTGKVFRDEVNRYET